MEILVADHHPQALWVLKTTLPERSGFKIAGEATDAGSLLALAAEVSPDLVLVDSDLPGMPIEELIAALHEQQPGPIVMVMSCKPESGRKLLKAGADAFVSKGDEPEWLLETLEKFEKETRRKRSNGRPITAKGE
jgi:DNA-binding NarL/FixJ family response regulator